jgi:rhodanese-related sulfurtransferase
MTTRSLSLPILLLLAFMATPLTGCSMESGPELSAPDAFARAERGELTLIDIRTPPEWRQTGTGQGAYRVDMRHPQGTKGFVGEVLALVGGDRSAPVGLICRTGNRSGHMQRALMAEGFTNVYNVKEGMVGSGAGPGWVRRGLPVEPCSTC